MYVSNEDMKREPNKLLTDTNTDQITFKMRLPHVSTSQNGRSLMLSVHPTVPTYSFTPLTI